MSSRLLSCCRQALDIASSVTVMGSLPMLGLSTLKALVEGRAGQLLPDETDPAAAMEEVVEACSLEPFMQLLCGPTVEACAAVVAEALDVATTAQVSTVMKPWLMLHRL